MSSPFPPPSPGQRPEPARLSDAELVRQSQEIGEAGRAKIEKFLPYAMGLLAALAVFWVGTRDTGKESSTTTSDSSVAAGSGAEAVIGDVRTAISDAGYSTVSASGSAEAITLTGSVASEADRIAVVGLVEGTSGVGRVRDQLTISTEEVDAPLGSGDVVADVDAVLAGAGLTGAYSAGNGDPIVLNGVVPTDEQRERAAKLALEVPGVEGVVNGIQVTSAVDGVLPTISETVPAVAEGGASTTIDAVAPAPETTAVSVESAPPIDPATTSTVAVAVVEPPAVPIDPAPVAPSPVAPPPVAPVPPTVDAIDASLTELLTVNPVQFETFDGELTAASSATLDQVAATIIAAPAGVVFEIAGHTDSRGPADDNQRLSEARAQTVVDYLVGKGVAAERLVPIGYGESAPISATDRSLNRRVEIRVVR